MKTLPLVVLLSALVQQVAPAAPNAVETGPRPYPPRLQWWADARFGMFIHWGPVSLKGTEIGWSRGGDVPEAEYDALFRQFNPARFDARAWAQLAREAGMKYVVLTTKHHDGFCLWDTRYTDYNIMRTPFGRDVTRELAEACRAEGLVFCAYHSVLDWWHPDYPLGSPGGKSQKPAPDMARYNQYLQNQVAELLQSYGPLGILWFDGEWESPWTTERGQDLYRHCRSIQDSVIVNNRVGRGREGMGGTTAQEAGNPGDYDTPEQTIGRYQDQRPWETCMTLCNQWAWKAGDPMKSLRECLHALIRCAGGDGNLLFNVGPMPSGEIEPRQVLRLREMGAWLQRYGHTLRGTRGGPWKTTGNFASTRTGTTLYLHLLNPDTRTILLPALPRKILRAQSLTGGSVRCRQAGDTLEIVRADATPDPIDSIVQLDLDGSAMDLPALSLTPEVKATASNVFEKQSSAYGPQAAFDGDPATRWATDSGTHQAWICAEFGRPKTVGRVRIEEACGSRVQRFEFQYRQGDKWKTAFAGRTLGPTFEKSFEKITAREFRLLLQEASEGPTLAEIQLSAE